MTESHYGGIWLAPITTILSIAIASHFVGWWAYLIAAGYLIGRYDPWEPA